MIDLTALLAARRESRRVEFKQRFDPHSGAEWCEMIKDIVAIANSGGGGILFGADNRGMPVDFDPSGVLALDPAVVTDKIYSYTAVRFADFEILQAQKGERELAAFMVGEALVPIVFTEPGTYAVEKGRQKAAFSRGTVYFRHGAKSEPASRDDLAEAIERRLGRIRKEWLSGVRKVTESPTGSRVAILPPEVHPSDDPEAVPIRIVEDASAQAFRLLDIDKTHPFRQKELILEVRKRIPRKAHFNQYDVQVLRMVYPILETVAYSHQPRFGSRQFSQEAVDWIARNYKGDREFFRKARESRGTARTG